MYFPDDKETALNLRLSDLDQFHIHFGCHSSHSASVKTYFRQCGDQKLRDFLGRLTCQQCKGKPVYAYLTAGQIRYSGAPGQQLWLMGHEQAGAA